MSKSDNYKEIKIFEFEGAVVRVHIPDLTEEEHDRRMKEIGRTAARLLFAIDDKTMNGVEYQR